MDTVPEVNRRKAETGLTAHVLETLIGKQSRKVAFGVWGFIAADTLISTAKIDQQVYWKMFLTCALLIGFGTILDDIVATFGKKMADLFADKVSTVVKTKETEVTTSVSTDLPKS